MDTSDSTTFKRCTKCQTEYPAAAEYFNRNKRSSDGLHTWCNACRAAYREANRERDRAKDRERYYADHDATLEKTRAKYWKNPEARREAVRRSNAKHADKRRAYAKVYNKKHYAENAEYLRQWQREYHRQHPEKRAEYQAKNADKLREKAREYGRTNAKRRSEYNKQFWKANPEKRRIKEHRRRAQKQAARGSYTAADIESIRLAQTDKRGRVRCWYCGTPMQAWHIDHKTPLARGGSNGSENLCLACADCNLKKHAKTPGEFAGRLI